MDQPQHQVFGTDTQSYRYMAFPPQKQKLQLLYPGRFMDQSYHYTGENIPNANPIGLEKTRKVGAALAKAAKMEQKALDIHLGGKNKVLNHPAVAPDAMIEDPSLIRMTMQDTSGINPNLQFVPDKYGNLSVINREDHKIVAQERIAMHNEGTSPMTDYNTDNILSRYDWKKIPEREYYGGITDRKSCSGDRCTTFECNSSNKTCTQQTCNKDGSGCGPYDSCDYKKECSDEPPGGSSDKKTIMWIALAVIGFVAIVAIALFIYGIYRHRKTAEIIRPQEYHIVSPEFIPSSIGKNQPIYPQQTYT